ncbi:MAG: TIR domain-containing protein [Tissierella sp.]|nr:TIR domain-containing protein [Tissierella sp.]
MKVFISWSGERSKKVGELLDNWLQCVLQAIDPWMSSKDIDRGSLWFSQINDQLKNTGTGIVCITSSNLNKPWILFEAGALAKGLSSSRVCTFLIDISPTDISDPLAQFNHTLPTEDGLWSLVKTLNSTLDEGKLSEKVLENVFNTYWPQFKDEFEKILLDTKEDVKPIERDEEDILSEILYSTRSLEKRMRSLENKTKIIDTSSESEKDFFTGEILGNGLPKKIKFKLNDSIYEHDSEYELSNKSIYNKNIIKSLDENNSNYDFEGIYK